MNSRKAKVEAAWELRLGLLHARAKESGYRYIPPAEREGGIYLTYEEQRANQLAWRLLNKEGFAEAKARVFSEHAETFRKLAASGD